LENKRPLKKGNDEERSGPEQDRLTESDILLALSIRKIARIGTLAWDPGTKEASPSEDARNILGLAPDEKKLTMDTLLSHIHPDDREQAMLVLGECIEVRNPHNGRFDARVVMADGPVRYVSCTSDAFEGDAGGRPARLYTIVQDVTEGKLKELEVKKERAILNRAQSIAHVGNWAWDLRANTFTWSDELFRIFGYNPREFEPTMDWLMSHFHPSDREMYQKAVDAAFKENKYFNIDIRIVRSDGSTRYVNCIADKCVKDKDGKPKRLYGIIQDITDHKLKEVEIKKERAILNRAQSIAHVGNWAWDLRTDTFTWSDELFRIFGYNPQELEPTMGWLLSRIHPADKDVYAKAVDAAFKQNKYFNIDVRVVRPDGSIRYINSLADKCVRDKAGKPTRLFGILQDITDRKRQEEEVKKNMNILNRAQQIAHVGNWALNLKTNSFTWSDEVFRIFGFNPQEFKPDMDWLSIHVHPADKKLFRKSVNMALCENKLFYIDMRVVRPDGSIRYVNWVADRCGRDAVGNPTRLFGIIQDVTDRKHQEGEIKKNAGILERAQQIAHVGNWALEIKNKGFQWSDEVFRIFGYEPKDFKPTMHWVIYHAHNEDKEKVRAAMESAIKENKLFNIDYRITTLEGNLKYVNCLADRSRKDRDGNVEFIYGIIQDITDRKVAELEILKAQEGLEAKVAERTAELEKANRAMQDEIEERKRMEMALDKERVELKRSNEELEQFAYIASHDLQEPLRMVNQYVQLLGKRYKGKLDPRADEYIQFSAEGTARMRQMIVDLLEFSRVGTRTRPPEPTNLEEVVNQVMSNLTVAIGECNAKVTHDPMPVVLSDFTQIMHVFQNLVGNAIKFRKEGVPPEVHIGAESRGEDWVFSVADNGIGIDPKYFNKLFIIFQRLNSAQQYKGNGIGLAICKKIIERHGGRIWVESTPGQGTTFFFTLPASTSPEAGDNKATEPVAS